LKTKAEKLRELFEKKGVVRLAGAHDGLTAKLVELNGFDAIWAGGFEVSTSYAVPDADILTMSHTTTGSVFGGQVTPGFFNNE
jgi:phosphoenolpyruvate phosphomutase